MQEPLEKQWETTLLTPEDISRGLLAEDTKEMVANEMMSLLSEDIRTNLMTLTKADDELYEEKKEKLVALLTDQIAASISELPIGEIIAEESAKAIKEKFQGGLMAMMLNDSLIQSVTTPLGEKLQEHIQENGASYIQPILQDKITQLEQSSVLQLLETMDIADTAVKKTVTSVYETLIQENIEKLLAHFQISQMIEEKINKMPIEDLEDLVLSVMKKELDTIVNLGAVIGFLIGIINIFI